MRNQSQLCLGSLDLYYSDAPLTTHGPSALEMRIGLFEKEKAPGRFEDLAVCFDALTHVRQVRLCLSYLMTHPVVSASESDMDLWLQAFDADQFASRLALTDALWIAASSEVEWSRMNLEV